MNCNECPYYQTEVCINCIDPSDIQEVPPLSEEDINYYANMPLEPTGNGIIYGDGDVIPF